MEHTFTELLWLLLIYSFIGWIIEAAVGTIKNKKFTNRGFSTGPFCLVYGVAAVLMEITLSELIGSPFFLFLGCGIQATFVEWFTGKTLERTTLIKSGISTAIFVHSIPFYGRCWVLSASVLPRRCFWTCITRFLNLFL